MSIEYAMTTPGKYIFLAALFGVVTTFARYSGYGISDQIEHLPIINSAIDRTYLL
jgi:hypothetical protein